MKLNPAQYVVHIFGGVRSTARIIGRSAPTVGAWRKSTKKGGTGGRIPSSAQIIILRAAKQLNLSITPNDLIYGRSIKKNGK